MKRQNNLFRLRLALLYVFTLTAGCEAENNQAKKIPHNEEYVQRVNKGDIKEDTYKGSVYRVTSATIDSLRIKIQYGSPGVRNRVIWGKLVPYDTVWVSGALQATAIEFSKEVKIGGKKLKSGKYAFFTIPGRKSWTIIINKDYQQHNAYDYDRKKDLVRLDVVPDTLSQPIRRLTYSITKGTENNVHIVLAWEKLRIPFTVEMINEHNH